MKAPVFIIRVITTVVLLLAFSLSHAQSVQNKEQGMVDPYSSWSTHWFNPGNPQHTYCNPVNIDYDYRVYMDISKGHPFRSTADPVIVPFKGQYYLFSTNQQGFYWSDDLAKWNFVYSSFHRLPTDDDLCAPATLVLGDTLVYMGSTYNTLPVWITTHPKRGRWIHLIDSSRLPAWDPALFKDDDGKLYLYYGSSDKFPIKGVQLNKKTFCPVGDQQSYKQLYQADNLDEKQKATGDIKELVSLHPDLHGWERFGMNNDDTVSPWGPYIEGAWMTKHNDRYYLQYAAPGTEFKVYADGVYVGDNPLGPFSYQRHNPFSYKPGGFITGAGHGSTFSDYSGNYWHVATCMVSVKYKFERRIGLYPAGFDSDGVLYTNTAFGDYPTYLTSVSDSLKSGDFTGWMLLSYKKKATASSIDSTFMPENAFDESIRTFWSAKGGNKGEWLEVDLGRKSIINAIQINYADHHAFQYGKAMDLYHRYKIYMSDDGTNWTLLIDKSYNDLDVPHDYVELTNPAQARYLKLVNVHMASGYFALCGFRVFGKAPGNIPPAVRGFRVDRSDTDPRNASIYWQQAGDAYGYNIYFGIEPEKLYNCITVNGNTHYDFRGMDRDKTYYFSIEALNETGISKRSRVIRVGE